MKKNRRERKLTRLVLGALMLGAGTLFAPTAEAATTATITNGMADATSMQGAGMYQPAGINCWALNSSVTYNVLTINGVHTNWKSWDFAGYARNSNSGTYGPVTVAMNNGELRSLYGVLLTGTATGNVTDAFVTKTGGTVNSYVVGGRADKGNAIDNSVQISGGTVGQVMGGWVGGGYKANSNAVHISNSATINNSIKGGYIQSGSGEVNENTVNIMGGSINANVYGGASDDNNNEINMTKNTVSVNGGTIGSGVNIHGAWSSKGLASENSVTIDGGTFQGNNTIYGGHSNTGDVMKNKVDITIGTVGDVYGGHTNNGVAGGENKGNTVKMSGGTVSGTYGLNGGWVETTGNATYNSITISGGEVTKAIRGGRSNGANSTANYNTVEISGANTAVGGSVMGGIAFGTGTTVDHNKITMKAGTVGGMLYGGYTETGIATNNTVEMTGGVVSGENEDHSRRFGINGGWVETTGNANNNKVTISGGESKLAIRGGRSHGANSTANYNTVEISGADTKVGTTVIGGVAFGGNNTVDHNSITMKAGTVEGMLYGGFTDNGNATNNTVTMTGGTVKGEEVIRKYGINGGWVEETGNANNNSVTISGGESKQTIRGGRSHGEGSEASGNSVTISGEAKVGENVFGGRAVGNNTITNNNTVTINGGEITTESVIYGGDTANTSGSKAVDNKVNINAAVTVKGILVGRGATSSGNTLNLGATGITVGADGVSYTQTINIGYTDAESTHTVAFENGKTVLSSAGAITGVETLDISADAAKLAEATTAGNMRLLSGGDGTNFSTLKLKYSSADAAAISDAGTKVKEAAKTDAKDGVTLGYTNTHTVKRADTNKAIDYTITNTVNAVTPGEIAWSAGGTARALTTAEQANYTFDANTAVNASGLTFTGTSATDPMSKSMTLLSGATGITGGHITQPTAGKGEVTVAYTDAKGVGLEATATGVVSVASNAVNYTINSVTLDSVDLSNWNGTTDALPTTWTGTGVAVATGNFAALTDLGVGESRNIFATSTANFFGTVSGDREYKSGTFADDTDKGVTFSGNKFGGVKTTESGKNLTYYAETMDTTAITLGAMTWGTGRTAASGYDFRNVGTVTATDLKFDFTDAQKAALSASSKMTLLSGATNLEAGKTVTGTPSQTIDYTASNGAALNGTFTGEVSTTAGQVNYAAKTMTLDSVTLSGWDGATASAVPTGWTASGVSVATENMANLPELAPGASRDILTTATAGAFSDDKISETNKYKDYDFTPSEAEGVKLTGKQKKGVKADDGGTKLVYAAGKKDVAAITLGAMDWGKGRTASADYDFANVGTIDATDLTFTFTDDQKEALSASSTMTLLDKATNLKADQTVTGADRTQKIAYTASNGAALNGTFTGTVSTAAGAVNYAATGMTLDSVTLSGWNGKESAVPSGWTASDTLSVTGDGFTEPALSLGTSATILTTDTDKYFANASIDPKLVGKELDYSEEAKNVSLSGMEVRSVKADGKNLVYASEKANIDAVAIGSVTYDKGATLLDRSGAVYDYSKVSALDTRGFTVTMTDAQAKAAQVSDSMTLLKANATLTDIGAIDAGTAGEYDYTPTAGMNVTAAVQGSVSATGGSVLYSVTGNNASSLNFETVKWDSTYKRTDGEALYTTAMVNTTGVVFTGTDSLATGAEMLLVENYGDSIQKSRGDTFKLGDFTGKGYAYYKDGGLYFLVEKGTSTEPEPAVPVKGQTVPVEEDHIGDVSGGEAKGDGDATGNEVDVKKGVTVEGDVTGGKTEGKGESKDNKVDIDGGTIETGQNGRGGDVTGGKSDEGNTKGNEATVENGSKVDGGVTGGQTDKGDAEGNTATVTGESVIGTEEGGVTGGRTGEGESKGNEATVEDSTVNGDVTGGESGKGGVKENKTNVKDSEVKPNEQYGDASADVTGGRTGEGDATGNETTVEGTKVTSGNVTGGQSEKGDAGGNKTNATDSDIKGNVTGGSTGEGDAGKNETTVDGSTVTGSVTGGETKNGNATENETTVTGSTVTGGDITGGKSGGEGNADENKTGVSSSTVEGGNVTGGSSEKGNADKNETTVKDGKVTGDVTGGTTNGSGDAKENKTSVDGSTTEITGSVTGGQSKGGNTDKNETSVTGGSKVNGDVTGGSTEGSGTASENKANVEGVSTQVGGDVTGGKTTGSGDAKENKTSVDKSTVGGSVTGGSSESGSTDKNEMTVTGGTVNGDVTGGKTTGSGTASENKTSVSGSTVGGDTGDGNVTGGQSEKGSTDKNETSVTGSTVKGSVNGGQTGGEGTASENKAKATGSTVGSTEEDGVIGGATENGKAEGNEASVTGGSTVTGNVAGAISQNGSLEGNTATVEGKSKVTGDVTGGVGETGAVSGNTASVSGESEIKAEVAGGVTGGSGEAKGNKASVEGSTVGSDKAGHSVIGGSSENDKAEGNEASVKGSVVTGGVIGASSAAGEVETNIAAVDGSDIEGSVEGAQTSGKGAASSNQATVGGESTVAGSVTGATTDSGEAKENKASVTGGSTVTKDVKGAVSTSGTVTANEATIDASVVEGSVAGATTAGAGTATLNIAAITNSKITGSVAGATSEQGAVTQNQATVTGGSVGGDVMGGYSKEGSASNNTVNVMQTVVGTEEKDGNIYGGKTDGADKPADANSVTLDGGANVNGGVFGGYSENGTADGNIVTIKSATIRDYLYGGKSKSKSSNDEVYFENGSVLGIIGGGCAEAVSNKAELSEGTVNEHVIGGFASETATGNTVTMTGGTVNGSVIGGYGRTTAADNNTVLLSGGTVEGETITSTALGGVTIEGGVYGGYGAGTTRNNTVTLCDAADVSKTGLIGGSQEATGNTLNLGSVVNGTPTAWTGGNQSVQNISNFETINFTVVPWDESKAAVTITDGSKSDLSSTTVSAENVTFTGVKSLANGDAMTLIAMAKNPSVNEKSTFTAGMSVEGTGALSLDDSGNVVYNVKSVKASDQTHNTVMGAEAAMTALSMGNDFILDAKQGLGLQANIGSDGVATFAKLGGGKMKQETGSHINVNTWNAILALGHTNKKEKSSFEYGAFFEYGSGNYTTENNAAQHGDGSASYTGGGLLAKWTANHGLYVEGSFRAGTVHDDARNLLRDDLNAYSYETNANYLGFSVGVGKEIEVANGNVVDVYGRYFYNRRNGSDFTVNGDDFRLDAVTSSVLRVGARYTMKREKWNFFGGLAYEHEMDGKANGHVNGIAIEGADIGGGSFRGELGATMKPSEKSPWSLDFSVVGYAGKKQGVMGGVSVTFGF